MVDTIRIGETMKKLIIILAILFMASVASADTWLIVDKTTKEVKSLSPEDDAQLEKGWEKIILPFEFKDVELQYHPTYYLYKNNKFIVNIKKLSDEALAQQEIEEQAKERELINKETDQLAIKSLKGKGVELKYNKEND